MTDLQPHGIAVLAFTAIVFALFVWDRWPIATVSMAILAALPLGFALFPLATAVGEVEPTRFFNGFGNPALVAICSLMVVGHALVVTGALEPAARRLATAVASHPRRALLAVLVVAAAASGVVNDTPVVVLFIPLLLAAAKQAKTAAAGLLLPMNYAVLIGGMATTIGTSTNLIVVAIAASLGVGPFGVFSYFSIVAMAAVPALAYLWLVAPRLLRGVPAPQEETSDDVFDAELYIEADSPLDGKQVREALTAVTPRLPLVALRRGEYTIASLPSVVLRPGDRLVLRDTAERLKSIERQLAAVLHNVQNDRSDSADATDHKRVPSAVLAQLIVTPQSPQIGNTIRQQRLAERFDVVVVGLRSRQVQSGWQRVDLADRHIAEGDVLLLQGETSALRATQLAGIGLLLDDKFALPRQEKAPLAMAVMIAVVLLAATKIVPIALAALGGALVLLLTRCLSWEDVTQALSTKVILLVAASLALGDALTITGATAWLAQGLAALATGLPPAWVMALLMALMGLVTNFVSNNAAAAIGTPLGVSLAQAMGAPAEPFVLAVLFGCNLCYLTPMGYQTNLLVMNAGGYRFADFLRVGAPLFLIMWAGLSWGLASRYAV